MDSAHKPRRHREAARRALWVAPLLALALALPAVGTAQPLVQQGSPQVFEAATATTLAKPRRVPEVRFRVASFNVLGARHTQRGGKQERMASGRKRIGWAVQALENNRISVAGLQEFQPPQLEKFRKVTGERWAVWPAARLGNFAMHNSIVWRKAKWSMVSASTVAIPYFNGSEVKMPYVLLKNLRTGRRVWFANFHNPADSRHRSSQERYRNQAARRQIELARRLAKERPPLVMTGDMNEKASYFCKLTKNAPMKSASGGSRGKGPCRPPERPKIDWIFGTLGLRFDDYAVVDNRFINKITDHSLIVTEATAPARRRR